MKKDIWKQEKDGSWTNITLANEMKKNGSLKRLVHKEIEIMGKFLTRKVTKPN